ncbi:4Fe-4S dicluster domain-containing protein [bacterium]|nr:4Fe-4S dicluster domain-containing protein [bacterium]
MPSLNGNGNGSSHWRGLPEAPADAAVSKEAENALQALLPKGLPEANRRRFLKLMGASLALASAAGCHRNNPSWPRWPQAEVLPYTDRPDGRSPGTPVHYATALEIGGVAKPVLGKSYDGRPIKVEGNPEHPASQGAADVLAQASILEMYDPERSRSAARYGNRRPTDVSRNEALAAVEGLFATHRAAQGEGLRILSESSSSPTLAGLKSRVARELPKAQWHEWEAVSRDNERAGAQAAFGRALRATYRLDAARVVVSLEDDFLGTHPHAVRYARDFAALRRADDGTMSRLFAVESMFSLTGSNADVRLAIPSGAVEGFAWSLAAHLVLDEHVALPDGFGALQGMLRQAAEHHAHPEHAARMARELKAAQGHALITVGPSQPASVHALAHVLNAALGAPGHTVDYREDPAGASPTHLAAITDLVAAMNGTSTNGGGVSTLLILGGNPVYDAPADLAFADALVKVPQAVHLSLFRNETTRLCTWHLPRAHAFESWGDCLSWDGTYTLTQPLMAPLFGGLTTAEVAGWMLDGTLPSGEQLTRATFEARGNRGAKAWRRALHDGLVRGGGAEIVSARPRAGWTPESAPAHAAPSGNSMEVTFATDAKVWDGRFSGNPWLQELPDPMTKITWDNAALIAPATARDLGIGMGDLLTLTHDGRTLEIAAYLMPGQAPGSLAIPLGWGRHFDGRMAERDAGDRPLGFNAYQLRGTGSMHMATGVQLAHAGGRHELVTTQHHHVITDVDNGKQIQGQAQRLPQLYREAELSHYREHPEFAKHMVHHPPLKSLWEEHSYDTGYRWGMTIDLAACNGCSACVLACQAENNIPVTGKEEVSRGREMHWIRIDRYFKGDSVSPEVAHQPVTCHHCENAPCEQVCPVAATTHSSEGLNDMVYNRCVGTRYCSNNCPYKVRRFNYFNNQSHQAETTKMQYNPDVTVRARGVMEKCTYCVQRIKAATIPAKNEGRSVKDGEIVPACAQTCPTDAIVFGDLNDPGSRVRRLQENARAYAMLAELNVKPRTNYLAKIRNGGGHGSSHDAGNGHAAGSSENHSSRG